MSRLSFIMMINLRNQTIPQNLIKSRRFPDYTFLKLYNNNNGHDRKIQHATKTTHIELNNNIIKNNTPVTVQLQREKRLISKSLLSMKCGHYYVENQIVGRRTKTSKFKSVENQKRLKTKTPKADAYRWYMADQKIQLTRH